VVGLTEVVLALAMIGILIWRPGGLFATAEIGAARLFRGGTRQKQARLATRSREEA